MTLVRIANEKRIPFDVKAPNTEALEACKESKWQGHSSVAEMFRDLGIWRTL